MVAKKNVATSDINENQNGFEWPTFQELVLCSEAFINNPEIGITMQEVNKIIKSKLKRDYDLDFLCDIFPIIHKVDDGEANKNCNTNPVAEQIFSPNLMVNGVPNNILTGEKLLNAAGKHTVWKAQGLHVNSKVTELFNNSPLSSLFEDLNDDWVMKICNSLSESFADVNFIENIFFPKHILNDFDFHDYIKNAIELTLEKLMESIDLSMDSPDEIFKKNEINEVGKNGLEVCKSFFNKMFREQIEHPFFKNKAKEFLNLVDEILKVHYRTFLEKNNQELFDQLKNIYEREKNETAYHNELLKLQKETRSPKLYGQIIQEGVPIDQNGAAAAALLLRDILNQTVDVSIINEKDETFYFHADHVNKNTIILSLNLKYRHYGESEIIKPENSCLYDAILKQVPEVLNCEQINYFSSDTEFRKALSKRITKDSYFRKHIKNGWHFYTINKESYGGKLLPAKNTKKYDELLGPHITVLTKDIKTELQSIEKKATKTLKTMKKVCSDIDFEELNNTVTEFKNLQKVPRHQNKKDLLDRKDLANIMIAKFNNVKELISTRYVYHSRFDEPIRNLKESVLSLLNKQEQLPSQETLKKLQHYHLLDEQKAVQKSSLQEICEDIAAYLQKCNNIFPQDENNNILERGQHTVAAGVIPSKPEALLLAFNYFNITTNQSLDTEQKTIIIAKIVKDYGEKLLMHNISKISILKRADDERLEVKNQYNSKASGSKTDQKTLERALKDFEHEAHAEMFFPAVEKALAERNHSSPEYHKIAVGVGKGSCIRCQAYFDNVGISNHIAVGDIQAKVPRHIHPSNIKFEYEEYDIEQQIVISKKLIVLSCLAFLCFLLLISFNTLFF